MRERLEEFAARRDLDPVLTLIAPPERAARPRRRARAVTPVDGALPVGGVGPRVRPYHDEEWGRPVRDDRGLFERLSLEAFQSGLSWLTILRKREAFRAAFAGFEIDASRRSARPTSSACWGRRDRAQPREDRGGDRERAGAALERT